MRTVTTLVLVPAIMALAGGVRAEQAPARVAFSPSSIQLRVGERALVRVVVAGVGAPGLAALQLDLSFDPTRIRIVDPNERARGAVPPFAALGKSPMCRAVGGARRCEEPEWMLTRTGRTPIGTDRIDNVEGRIVFAYGTHGTQDPAVGSGTIALIEVYGLAPGQTTVDIDDAILAGNEEPPAAYPVRTSSLQVAVTTGLREQPRSEPGGSRLDGRSE